MNPGTLRCMLVLPRKWITNIALKNPARDIHLKLLFNNFIKIWFGVVSIWSYGFKSHVVLGVFDYLIRTRLEQYSNWVAFK